MSIAKQPNNESSSVGAAWLRPFGARITHGPMPLLRSLGDSAFCFYRHGAPTELALVHWQNEPARWSWSPIGAFRRFPLFIWPIASMNLTEIKSGWSFLEFCFLMGRL